jgi:ribosomal protein S27AE
MNQLRKTKSMKCPKCERSMVYYPQLKRFECHYCEYILHKHEISKMRAINELLSAAKKV